MTQVYISISTLFIHELVNKAHCSFVEHQSVLGSHCV